MSEPLASNSSRSTNGSQAQVAMRPASVACNVILSPDAPCMAQGSQPRAPLGWRLQFALQRPCARSSSGGDQDKRQDGRGFGTPPPEMRARDASLPKKMTGGVRNPLGRIALYLGNAEYRIHGTNDAKSIGRAQSSGCFRRLNSAALHLATLADIGTRVVARDNNATAAKDGS